MAYARKNGYDKEEILFVGDDFDDGGGDSQIRTGGIDYVRVRNYKQLGEEIKPLFTIEGRE